MQLKASPTYGHTSHNKRFSEMAVGVETESLLLPMTPCDSSGHGAPRPPLRQAAERYTTYALLRRNAEKIFFDKINDIAHIATVG